MTKWEAKRWWWIVRSICVAQFFVVASVAAAAAATVVVDDESNLQKSFSHTSNSARCCCAVIVVAIVAITVVAVTARQIMQATVVPVVEKCPAWILFGFFWVCDFQLSEFFSRFFVRASSAENWIVLRPWNDWNVYRRRHESAIRPVSEQEIVSVDDVVVDVDVVRWQCDQ